MSDKHGKLMLTIILLCITRSTNTEWGLVMAHNKFKHEHNIYETVFTIWASQFINILQILLYAIVTILRLYSL